MQKPRLLTTQAGSSILLGRELFPAWTDCLWLSLRTTTIVLFARGMSEKPKCTKEFPLGQVHALLATMSSMWLPIWQTSILALHRTLLGIFNSSTSFYLTKPAGLSDPAAALLLHPGMFLSTEAQKYWTSHQSTSKL